MGWGGGGEGVVGNVHCAAGGRRGDNEVRPQPPQIPTADPHPAYLVHHALVTAAFFRRVGIDLSGNLGDVERNQGVVGETGWGFDGLNAMTGWSGAWVWRWVVAQVGGAAVETARRRCEARLRDGLAGSGATVWERRDGLERRWRRASRASYERCIDPWPC